MSDDLSEGQWDKCMVSIRAATIEDARILAAAGSVPSQTSRLLASGSDELDPRAFASKIETIASSGNGFCGVAEKEGRVVACVLLDPSPIAGRLGIVHLSIFVQPESQGEGIGERLLRRALEWANAAPGMEKIELQVCASDLRAIRLFQKLGFVCEGRRRRRAQLADGTFLDDLELGFFAKAGPPTLSYVGLAIGWVESTRNEILDDDWDREKTCVVLDGEQFNEDALAGLAEFSHAEVLFHMHRVDAQKIQAGARHPRGNSDWPAVGIFAQRAKWRPNGIGATICRIVKVEGLRVWMDGLDAIDGTPVLDLKPWVREFAPRGQVKQPQWMSELMREYWLADSD